MSTRDLLAKLLFPTPTEPQPPLKAGLYHYMRSAGQDEYAAGEYTRFHLRVDPDGRGLLLANASAAAHLSPSGAVIAQGLLEDDSEEEIIARLQGAFRGADRQTIVADLEHVARLIAGLVAPGDNYPVMNLEDSAISPFDAHLMAPFQADVVLAPPAQIVPVLDKLWQANIPHVIFMASQIDDRSHLIQAVERAEDLGMIAGIRVRATDIDKPSMLEDLAMAGLDHCNVLHISANPVANDRLFGAGDHAKAIAVMEKLQTLEIAPVAELPLLPDSATTLRSALDQLLQIGVSNVNFLTVVTTDNMPSTLASEALSGSALPQMADLVEEVAAEMDVRFIWQPPVQRDPEQTLSEQIHLGPRCTSDVSIRVLPNGDVLPPRGPDNAAGNLFDDNWGAIWSNAAFVNYRKRVERPTHCEECPGLVICAADCPREPVGWSQGLGGSIQ